jgi:hypothetical protein
VDPQTNDIILDFDSVLATYGCREKGLIALSKYQHWFPLRPSAKLAGIVADLMGDGHLQGTPKYRFDYCSKFKRELRRFNTEIFSTFQVHGKIRDCKTNQYGTMNLGVNNKPLSRTLGLIGVPAGPKVSVPFLIPAWILRDKYLFARFVNRLFSCEGHVDIKSRCVEIQMYKSIDFIDSGFRFFNQLKSHLDKYFCIRTTDVFFRSNLTTNKRGITTIGIRMKIKNKDSLVKFHDFIGIEDKRKKESLKRLISALNKN